MAGDKSRDIHPCFHNGPLWVGRKKKHHISNRRISISYYTYTHMTVFKIRVTFGGHLCVKNIERAH